MRAANVTRKRLIEDAGYALINAYGEAFGAVTEPPVPVDMVAERLCGLTCVFQKLGRLGQGVLGAIDVDNRMLRLEERVSSEERTRFTIAHELGHFVLHSRGGDLIDTSVTQVAGLVRLISPSTRRDAEWEADLFAGALLVPLRLVAQVIAELNLDPTDRHDIGVLAKRFLVSWTAMDVRVRNFGYGRGPFGPGKFAPSRKVKTWQQTLAI